jgi:hypothetical protein
MRVPATIRWIALALLGFLIAAGVSIAASSLASQQIGLASEPINAGDDLAPAVRTHATPHKHRSAAHHRGVSPQTTTAPVRPYPQTRTPTAPPPTSSPTPSIPRGRTGGGGGDHSEGDRRGSGRNGADD